jgi:hypothetical protein
MFNVCPQCGQYSDEKDIDDSGPFGVCPFCGFAHRFERLSLFVLTGASGSGKSTIGLALVPMQRECVVMESGVLWRPEFDTPKDGYRGYRNLWLRVAKNISQAGRPVVLVGSAVPEQFEPCPERRYFATIHHLALICEDAILEQRLRARPAWRKSGTAEVLATMLAFSRWLREHAATAIPAMSQLDTRHLTIEQSAARTIAWIRQRLSPGAKDALQSDR